MNINILSFLYLSESPLAIPYNIKIKLVSAKFIGYTVVGLMSRKQILKNASYLGEVTGIGSIGLGNSGYVSCDGEAAISFQKDSIQEGSIITIYGDNEEVSFDINDQLAFSYKFKSPLEEVYLAANCYYDDILEIMD